MKLLRKITILAFVTVLVLSCEIKDGENLNGATTDSVAQGITRGALKETISGVLAAMRTQLATQIDGQSVAGREYWRIQSSDPRWTADLLTATLDDNSFYTTNPYAARYANIKNVNILLEGLRNTTADFTPEEIASARGFANTIKAHELLMVLNRQYQNGIRVDVNNPKDLGPFVTYEEGLAAIAELLSEAITDLKEGGSSFPFSIPSGFDTLRPKEDREPDSTVVVGPVDFMKFVYGLAARVAVYQGDYVTANNFLQNSFLDPTDALSAGAYMTFSLTGADVANPLFFALNATVANARIAHPSFIADAEMNDTRLGKVVFRRKNNKETNMLEPNPLTQDNLTGQYDVFVYTSNTASVPIMKNEELLLLSAEVHHITNPTVAVAAINVVRTAANLPPYTGDTNPEALVTEILKQRRYSLFAEGHRWIDMRRFNRLADLPIDRDGDRIIMQFPTPANENN